MRNMRFLLILPVLVALAGCDDNSPQPAQSTSGVHQAQVTVQTGSDGLTMEQRNVRRRLVQDNKPGALEYLYVISPDSGQILMYSGVDGKVTSSGKRLAPRTVAAQDGEAVSSEFNGIAVNIGGQTRRTTEVLEDDGTYGDSVPYIYWWDTNGVYHQHFFTGGQIIHVTSAPLHVNSNQILIQLEHTGDAPASTKTPAALPATPAPAPAAPKG